MRGSFQFDSRRQFAFLLRFFILAHTVGGEEGAGHIVPDGENGARDAAGRCEVHESQRGSQTGILHADLDGHSAGLCLIETEAAGADMAEQHAAEVMQDTTARITRPLSRMVRPERETTQPTVMMTTSAENIGMIVFTFFT